MHPRVEWTGRDDHGVGALLCDDRKRGVDFLRRAGFEDEQPPSERAGTLLRRLLVECCFRIVPIHQKGDERGLRDELVEHLEVLAPELGREPADAGDVRSRPVEAGNEPSLDRVEAAGEKDPESSTLAAWRPAPNCASDRRDDGDVASDQIGRQRLQLLQSIVRKRVFDLAALAVAGLVEALSKRLGVMGPVAG